MRVVKKNKAGKRITHVETYTTRWTKEEMSDLKRVAGVQGVPVSRLLRIALVYYYGANDEWDALKNVTDVAKFSKEQILENLKKKLTS